MAVAAGVNSDLLQCRTRLEFGSAGCADNLGLVILRMNSVFHVFLPSALRLYAYVKKVQGYSIIVMLFRQVFSIVFAVVNGIPCDAFTAPAETDQIIVLFHGGCVIVVVGFFIRVVLTVYLDGLLGI